MTLSWAAFGNRANEIHVCELYVLKYVFREKRKKGLKLDIASAVMCEVSMQSVYSLLWSTINSIS